MPIAITDTAGTVIFYNEHAEAVLNQRFDETGDLPVSEWSSIFAVADENRQLIPFDEWPLTIAYQHKKAVSRIVWLRCRDGEWRNISFTAFPIVGLAGQQLGAITVFWEV